MEEGLQRHKRIQSLCSSYITYTVLIVNNFETLQLQWKLLDEGTWRRNLVFLDESAALLEGWLLGYEWWASRQPALFESINMATLSQESVSHCLPSLCYCICGGREKDITKDSQQKDENRLGKVCLTLNKPLQGKGYFLCTLWAVGWMFLFCISNKLCLL